LFCIEQNASLCQAAKHMLLEERIRQLCLQALHTQDEEELNRILPQLREALRAHCDHMRVMLADYPLDLDMLRE
jgi:hypothetical protein